MTLPEITSEIIEDLSPQAQAIIALQQQQINTLLHQLADIKRGLFGSTSERFIPPDNQLPLIEEDADPATALSEPEESTSIKGYKRKKRKPKSFHGRFSPEIPRERGSLILPDSMTCPDCKGQLEQFSTRVCERLRYRKQVSYVVVQDELAVCRCPQCKDNIASARAPKTPLEGIQLDSSFLAHLISEKVEFGLPGYRIEERLRQHKVAMSRGTIAELHFKVGVLLLPLVVALEGQLKSDPFMHMDESGWKVARNIKKKGSKKKRKKFFNAWAWIALGASGDVVLKYWESCRKHDVSKVFGEYEGALVVDGKGHFDQFKLEMKAVGKEVTLSRCHSHARRRFEKALPEDREQSGRFMRIYQTLYRRERFLKEHKPPDTHQRWRRRSLQLIDLMIERCRVMNSTTLPKSLLGKAVRYVLKYSNDLRYYATTGDIPISNDAAERLFRKFVIGRKNWLFSGSEEGARSLAVLYSLVLTCKQNGIPVYEYLTDVIHRIGVNGDTDYLSMLPRAWAAARQSQS